ncbi:MAG TPA: 3-hydroxyacyl-CoA dehydrogenase [Deltaproteobacteria bacterium]|nr:3-hydroxyacyl-CoA dehydrogenase [Deltaproteobacteria bacterium]
MSLFSYERPAGDGVAILTMDMPGRAQNVWNPSSIAAFSEALDRLESDDGATGAIVTSAKKDFIAGADLESIQEMVSGDNDPVVLTESCGALSALLRRLETCGKPVVCGINGTALGGGYELALACHHRILVAGKRVQVGLPEASLGLLPGAGGTQRLPRLIGVKTALSLLIEGKRVRPDKALKLGLVNSLARDRDDMMQQARGWLATGPDAARPWDLRGFEVPGGGVDSQDIANIFMVGTAMFNAKTQGNYPAGRAILSCLFEGLRLPMDAALDVEKRYFVSLLVDPTASAMVRTLFLELQKANKLTARPAGHDRRPPQKIGVLGAGLMGAGIAYTAAKAGIDAVVIDLDDERASAALQYAARIQDKAISRGRSTEEKKAAILSRITATADYALLDGCNIVVEAVFENREIKATVTQKTEAVTGSKCVIGSNTSTLPITGLAEAAGRRERFIGLHFFSPVERMPLVEVIRGEQTSDETLAWALDYIQAIGKTPVVVNDRRGFYTSRVFSTYVTEGMVMLMDGVLPALIENAGRRTGMPMPPLSLADEVGLGLMAQVGRQTRKDLGDAAPHNPSTPLLETLVFALDRSGKRSGRGFYDYTPVPDGKPTKALWTGLAEHCPPADTQPSVEDLMERMLYCQCVEAARAMDEGVITDPGQADVGAILGWGFAPWTGGPFSYMDRLGVAAFVARADALADVHGERFRPPGLLRTMAAEGRSFFP